MVQTDILQLSKECNNWREALHSYRDEFNHLKSNLLKAANQSLSKEQYSQLDHFQNLIHIQLINIHDLKQSIKTHDRQVNYEVTSKNNQISDETLMHHERLYEEFQTLERTLDDVRTDINDFIDVLS